MEAVRKTGNFHLKLSKGTKNKAAFIECTYKYLTINLGCKLQIKEGMKLHLTVIVSKFQTS